MTIIDKFKKLNSHKRHDICLKLYSYLEDNYIIGYDYRDFKSLPSYIRFLLDYEVVPKEVILNYIEQVGV